MHRRSSRVGAFFALASVSFAAVLASPEASAQSTQPGRDAPWPAVDPVGEDRGFGRPVLDPRVEYGFSMRAQLGTATGRFVRSRYFERTGEMPVVVRFLRAPSATTLRVFEPRGVRWLRGGRPTVSGVYTAMVSEDGARALAADPMVGRVECDLFPAGPRPLDASATETRVEQARRAIFARDGVELDGRGVVIGDIDSAVFLYHPAFYHADGGVLEWRDVNGNGTFDAGTDGVDLDRNGTIEPTEVLKLFSAHTYDARLQRTMPASSLRPDTDWLYADTNGNARRDFGVMFSEDTPAYGEPIFVVDDANRNGTLDPSERILRLKTPKFRGINSRMEFLRGSAEVPLVGYDTNQTPQGFEFELHATGVAGILVGGVPGVSRLLGLAPRAEIVLTDYYGLGDNRDQGLVTGMQWVIDQGANVIVTEFAPYAGVTLDGSSEGEQLLDAFADNGGVPVSPAGNLATGFKHLHLNLAAGDNPIALTTDAVFADARFAQFSVHYRSSSRRARVMIGVPGLAPMLLPESAPRGVSLSSSVLAAVESSVTSRGTRMVHVSIVSRSALPQGEWTAAVQMDAGPAVEADLYVGDDRADWAGGFAFRDNDPTRTICYPSTSDKTISVAAYVLHPEAAFAGSAAMGALARYSSRGPRLDGQPGIEIGAPDNPLSTLSMSGTRVPAGSYMPFGGTSGAGPHVAAAAALLRQLNPEAAPGAIRAMILDHARRDSNARSDNQTEFGAGKLDMAAALGITATTGAAPMLTLRAPARVGPMREIRLEPTVTDDGPASELRARWDLDYDGTPDTPWQPVATQLVRAGVTGFVNVRVEVRDGQGYVSAATTRIQVVPLDQVPAEDRAFDTEFSKGCGCSTPGGRSLDSRGLTAMLLGAVAVALRWRRRRTRAFV